MSAAALVAPVTADDWFTEYLKKVKLSPWRRERLRLDRAEHPGDEQLRRERAYDAETAALLEQIHAEQEATG